ncbi:MAG: antibiotic biosynthesis monooxygenase [Chloroflexia bacterium]
MYGTVARVRIKAGAEQAILALSASFRQSPIPGQVAQYVYRMDADPQECYLAIIFESKEAYWANAQSPEQQARFEQLMALLEAEPEWHDGEIIES